MILGQVVGTVVATQKDEALEGHKFLAVRSVGLDLKPKKDYVVSVDTVGAGLGEIVVCVYRIPEPLTKNSPSRDPVAFAA